MAKLKRVTPEEIMAWDPCNGYDLEIVRGLFGKRKTLNAINILKINSISIEDRFWVVLRKDMIPENVFHEFACDCAEHVLHIFEDRYPEDKRPRNAIEIKRKWLRGEATDGELDAAWDAARAAAWDAARAAAWAAAWDAARAAAGDAARAAAWAAASKWMLDRLLELLKEL